jgi:hypothetical protein
MEQDEWISSFKGRNPAACVCSMDDPTVHFDAATAAF